MDCALLTGAFEMGAPFLFPLFSLLFSPLFPHSDGTRSGHRRDYIELLHVAGCGPAHGTAVLAPRRFHVGSIFFARHVRGLSTTRKAVLDDPITEAQEHFHKKYSRHFARTMVARHQWRLYEWLPERVAEPASSARGIVTVRPPHHILRLDVRSPHVASPLFRPDARPAAHRSLRHRPAVRLSRTAQSH